MTSTPPRSASTRSESYAVIGGEGFLGAALVSALIERHGASNVTSLGLTQRRFDPPGEYHFHRTDITSRASIVDALRASKATTVFHTASPHANASAEVWQRVNVDGTEAVVDACREAGVSKLVFTSSATVVFEDDALRNVDERIPTVDVEGDKGEPTYVSTKAKAEKIVLDANGKDGLLTCSLRLSGIIGPGDRQVIPGFIAVYKAGQASFQMGDNTNLFDFVTVRNVVHAHLLAAERLDRPTVSMARFNERLKPVACTVKRRKLPTSEREDVLTGPAGDEDELPLPAARTRFNQFYLREDAPPADDADPSGRPAEPSLAVAGQSFFISNGEPVPFWTFARAVYYAYSGVPQRWTLKLPAAMGMAVASVCELAGRVVGKRPEECSINTKYMQYVLNDMYFDLERARRLLGYEPIESLEEGIRSAVDWYKADEAKAQSRDKETTKSK
ncbi:hypothetical protein JCM10212_002484 [Sporobolomyces blumeae]